MEYDGRALAAQNGMVILSHRELGKKISAMAVAVGPDINLLSRVAGRRSGMRVMRGVAIKFMGRIEAQSGGVEFLFCIANRILVDVESVLARRKSRHCEIQFYSAGLHWGEDSIPHNFAFAILDSDCGWRGIMRG